MYYFNYNLINAYLQIFFIKQAHEYGNINTLIEYFKLILMVNVIIIKHILQFIYLCTDLFT